VDDFVINVRQIGQYPVVSTNGAGDLLLIQQGGIGGPYAAINPSDLINTAMLVRPDNINFATNFGLKWGTQTLVFDGSVFQFSTALQVPTLTATNGISINGVPVTTTADLDNLSNFVIDNTVASFNFRTGPVQLELDDVLRAGGAPVWNPSFAGVVTAPTPWDLNQNDDTVATTAWVKGLFACAPVVQSFNGRFGCVTLTTDDINAAYAAGGTPIAPNPALGDASTRIATTMFVDESLDDLRDWVLDEIQSGPDLSAYAPLQSPNFSGIPTAPTAATANSTGQLATTAFVHAAVTAATAGVSSFNTRTGAVVLTTADITGAGGAPIASPTFTGTPSGPTAAPGTSTTQLATSAFVMAALAAGTVESFNGRSGVVVLTAGDVTAVGGALSASPALTGTPTAPTPPAADNSTRIATTAFVEAAIGVGGGVSSFMGRTGAVSLLANDISAAGGALVASPAFTGTPTAPNPPTNDNSTALATTAWVLARLAAAGGVTTFNTRSGAVTLTTADVTGAGGAPLANPALTGTPTAPTAAPGTNSNQLATCAFVLGQLGVASFNTRTGAVTLTSADITGAGGALLASPIFTGTPSGPTAAQTDNSTMFATTAFVHTALNNSVSSFNGRTGAITLIANDISAAGGALLASPTFTGVPAAPTAALGTSTTQLATTQFVMNQLAGAGGVTTWNGRAGAVTMTATDITNAGGALASAVMGAPQCGRLTISGASPSQVIAFSPYQGALIRINGVLYKFANLTMTATNATINGVAGQSVGTNVLYYVYAYYTGTAVALDLSVTGHATSTTVGNEGTEIKAGDDSRTLVGIVYTTSNAPSSGSFADSGSQRYVRTWFNRQPFNVFNAGTNSGLTSTSGISVAAAFFICFANEKYFAVASNYALSTAQLTATGYVNVDGVNASGNAAGVPGGTTSSFTAAHGSAVTAEGYHTLAAYGQVSTSQANWTAAIAGMVG
jgi:hypothetical protein